METAGWVFKYSPPFLDNPFPPNREGSMGEEGEGGVCRGSMPRIFKISASTRFERPAKMKQDDQPTPDIRRPAKKCEICGIETLMGIRENSPLRARERWNGARYVRYCGEGCEK